MGPVPKPFVLVLVLVLEPGSRGRSPSKWRVAQARSHDRAEEIGVYECVYE